MSDTPQFSRRQMLLGTAVAGAAAGAAGVAGAEPSGSDGPAAADPRQVVLHDTPHTRTYYALARE